MQEVISTISTLLGDLLIVAFIILFYLSIKKCFWQSGKSRILLFFVSFFTNPFIVYVAIYFIMAIVSTGIKIFYAVFMGIDDVDALTDIIKQSASPSSLSIDLAVSWFIYLLFMFLFAYLIGKWLKAPNKSLVIFVYLLFSIILICTFKSSNILGNHPMLQSIINITDSLVQFTALFLTYHLDIKALSKMTSQRRKINWKIFVITPTVLGIIFAVSSALQFYKDNSDVIIAFYIFSDVLLFLFIWAFYVIIQNINATNDAIKAKDEVKTLSVEVMEALAHTIDAKDEYTRGHSVRVAKYSRMLAEKLGLSAEDCENVYYMALLHDIGKIGVPNEIINSTAKLTDDEYAVIKTHPSIGYDILSEIKSRPDLSIGARWHHERYDGKGYPDGKKGEDIPFFARIIAVADSYDAMTSNRSYRNYMPQDKVRFEIENNIGTQFDPDIAKCMLAIIDDDVDYVLHE